MYACWRSIKFYHVIWILPVQLHYYVCKMLGRQVPLWEINAKYYFLDEQIEDGY